VSFPIYISTAQKKALFGMLKSGTSVLKDYYKSPNEVGDVDVKFTLHFLLVNSNRTSRQ
jgi:hypothetical protein